MKKSISFLMPSFKFEPVGGFKIVFEYANLLALDGYDIHIVYPELLDDKKKPFLQKIKIYIKVILYTLGLIKRTASIWFPLNKAVHEDNILNLSWKNIPKTDLYVCTAVETSDWLNTYPIDSKQKFYFIQGYENWGRNDYCLRQTYHYSMQRIVISKWLKEIVRDEENQECTLVPNGFDLNKWHITIPIEKKNKYVISMLYHWAEIKGCKYSFAALDIVKKLYPQLKVNIFGTPDKPLNLPDWYDYYQIPSHEEHLRINNESAIYVAASLEEGWGLTVGEAMLCGQAVVCTDNRGFREMAVHNKNSLISPIKDADDLAMNIIMLIENDDLRHKLAKQGYIDIQNFSQEKSYVKFKRAINL